MRRTLSPDSSALFAQLQRALYPPSARRTIAERLWYTFRPPDTEPDPGPEVLAMFQQIADAGELAAAACLAAHMLDAREAVAAAAARALSQLLRGANPADLHWLQDEVWHPRFYSSAWDAVQPEALQRFLRWPEATATAMGVASSHWSGYIREAAVHYLARVMDGSELGFLILRLNDWVEPVRKAACRAVMERAEARYCSLLVLHLPQLLQLGERGRVDHAPVVAAVAELLRNEPEHPALLTGVSSGERQLARFCFRVASELPPRERQPLVTAALEEQDPILRLAATRSVTAVFADTALAEKLAKMWQDPFAPVRLEALKSAVAARPQEASLYLRRALLDRNAAVRNYARFTISQRESTDLRAYYRESLAEAAHREIALFGLSETGSAADAALATEFLASPVVRIRRAALRCVGRLAASSNLDRIAEALRDPSPAVVREARNILRKQVGTLGGDRLWSVFRDDSQPHVRRAALSLLAGLRTWDQIPYLLRATMDADPAIAASAQAAVRSWRRSSIRNFTHPAPEQLRQLNAALAAAGQPPWQEGW